MLCPAVARYPVANASSTNFPTITGSSRPHATGELAANAHIRSHCCFVLQDTVTPVFWARMNLSQNHSNSAKSIEIITLRRGMDREE